MLERKELPPRIAKFRHADVKVVVRVGMTLEEVEKEIIARTLEHTSQNRTQASDILGISRRSLYNKMRKFNMLSKR